MILGVIVTNEASSLQVTVAPGSFFASRARYGIIHPMSDESIESVYARRVLVPVANPSTAWNLLRLGALLAEPNKGEVIALHVLIPETGTDAFPAAQATLSELVEKLRLAGMPVRWHSVSANSPARGILDAAREENADLIVLGYFGGDAGSVLGPVVEAVARTTPSDLVVYRGHADVDVRRVILPANGSGNAKTAARLAVILSEIYHVPLIAVHVQSGYTASRWMGLARIAATLESLESAEPIERKVIWGNDVAAGILEEANEEDVIVLGFSERTQFERWLYGNVPQRVLRNAPGPVILTKDSNVETAPIGERARQWLLGLSPRLTPLEQEELRQHAADMARPNINFFMLVILSGLIATLGLLQNSAAVIIGAMLVAPLMSPVLGFAVGLVTGELRVMQSAAVNMTKGVGWAIVIAWGLGVLLAPIVVITPEIALRGRPSLLDMGIALFSGAAGAYATARRDVPAALAGVAIAAALVPPLSTVGIGAALNRWPLAGGALLLFMTNIASMALAAVFIFRWLGLRPAERDARPWRQRLGVLFLVVLLMAIPLTPAIIQIATQEADRQKVQSVLETTWSGSATHKLANIEMDYSQEEHLHVTATVRATENLTPHDVQTIQAHLTEQLGHPVTLDVVVLHTLHAQPPEPEPEEKD